MKKDDIKAIIIVTIITLLFPAIGIIQYQKSKDTSELIVYIASGIILALTFGFLIYLEQKKNYVVKKLKKTNSYIYAPITKIEYDEEEIEHKEFRLKAKINSKGIDKTIFANYDIKDFDVIKKIENKMIEKDIHDIKIWIDTNNYKEFEMDIEDLLERLNLLSELKENKKIPKFSSWGND